MAGNEQVARELGQLSEAVRTVSTRASEDRQAVTESLLKLHEGMESMRREMAGLTQSAQSTGTMVATMAQEKAGARLERLEDIVFQKDRPHLGERVDLLEGRALRVDGYIGSGWKLFTRAVLALLASGAISGSAFGVMAKIASHWH